MTPNQPPEDEVRKTVDEMIQKATRNDEGLIVIGYLDVSAYKYLAPWIEKAMLAYGTRQREEAMRECAELCRRKYPCGDPAHDERWCARCSAMQAQADMLEDEILSLLPPPGKERGE